MKIVMPNEEKDYVAVQMFMIKNTIPWTSKPGKIRWALLIFIFLVALLQIYTYSITKDVYNLVWAGFFIAFVLLYRKYLNWVYRYNFKKYFTLFNEGEISITLDEKSLKYVVGKITTTMKTKDIMKMFEAPECFYIQVRKGAMVYIPKRFVESIEGIREELQGYATMYDIDFVVVK